MGYRFEDVPVTSRAAVAELERQRTRRKAEEKVTPLRDRRPGSGKDDRAPAPRGPSRPTPPPGDLDPAA